jgi:ABC-type sugar transport system ATPase subunit
MASIQLHALHKRFGTTHILRGIELDVADGEFVVFVGPSGCGKSTLLRCIAGLESVSSGQVLIGGRDVTDAPASARGIAMVFQSYALYPHMTVRQNLGFGMRMRGERAEVVAAKLERAVQMLELEPYLERKPGELSGGQCQRVAIGRAIVQEPGVFLFDEPLSNLDAELRLRMRVEIAALHKSLATTMVYVTHDQVEAMTLAQRIVVLRAGQIEQVGTPMQLYHEPANTFVAGFIGTPPMNLLPAPAGEAAGVAQIGVRPEHLVPAPSGPLELVISVVEQLGASSFVHGRCTTSQAALCVEVRDGRLPAPGERLRLAPLPGRLHRFDADGKRVAAVPA